MNFFIRALISPRLDVFLIHVAEGHSVVRDEVDMFPTTQDALIATETNTVNWGITSGTQILSAMGAVSVEALSEGARIITRDAGMAVLRRIERIEAECEVVRIRAGSLGHDRPEHDTDLPANQKILIRDWRAQALTGQKQALMRVGRLEDGEFLKTLPMAKRVFYRLKFDRDHIIYADGLELFCPAL